MKLGEMVEARMQDAMMVGILMLSFAWLVIIGAVLPEYASVAGPVGYFAIIFGGLFGTEIAIREYVNSYPYLRILVRPDNESIHAFLSPPGATRRLGPNRYATTLDLRFPISFGEFKGVKRMELHHEREWSKRVKFRRGMCVWSGFSVPHPQTEIVEVFQVPKASVMMDHGEPVPVLILRSGSMDYYHGRPGPSLAEPLTEDYRAQVERERTALLAEQFAEATRQKSEWHQRAIAAEEAIEQQKAEIKGLLEAKSGLKELAYEYMLTIYQAMGSIEKALAHMRGTVLNKEIVKWIALTILGLAVVALVWANPDIVAVLASNVLVLVAVIVVAGVAAYLLLQRRKKHGLLG